MRFCDVLLDVLLLLFFFFLAGGGGGGAGGGALFRKHRFRLRLLGLWGLDCSTTKSGSAIFVAGAQRVHRTRVLSGFQVGYGDLWKKVQENQSGSIWLRGFRCWLFEVSISVDVGLRARKGSGFVSGQRCRPSSGTRLAHFKCFSLQDSPSDRLSSFSPLGV